MHSDYVYLDCSKTQLHLDAEELVILHLWIVAVHFCVLI